MLLILPAIPYAMATGTITVGTNARWYNPGDTVTINGTSTTSAATIYVTVNDTQGNVYKGSVTSDSSGKYKTSFTLASDAYVGVYRTRANDGTNKANTSFTVSDITPTDLANNMIKLTDDAQARSENLFKQLRAQGVTLSKNAVANQLSGNTTLTKAETLLSSGHPWESLYAARDAMIHFRDAIDDAWKSAKIDKIEDTQDVVIKAEIGRATNLETQLNGTVVKLNQTNANVITAVTDLKTSRTDLAAASTALGASKLLDAQTQVDKAKRDLEKVIKDLKPLSLELKLDGTLKFLNGAQTRVDNLEKLLRGIENSGNKAKIELAIARLEIARSRINQAINDLKLGKEDVALSGLTAAEANIKTGIGNIDGGKLSASLSNVNTLQAKIQYLQRVEGQLSKWGMNTSVIQSQIASLQTQLSQAQQTTTP